VDVYIEVKLTINLDGFHNVFAICIFAIPAVGLAKRDAIS